MIIGWTYTVHITDMEKKGEKYAGESVRHKDIAVNLHIDQRGF